MRRIEKLPEPRSLTEYRLTPGSNYEDFPHKQELREQLVREQRGLCCYCLNRIRPGDGRTVPPMKIAHWQSRDLHREQQLVYGNLLGACMGKEGNVEHCDTSQKNQDILYNPAEPAHHIDTRIQYLTDGTVHSSEQGFLIEIEKILNLNVKFMVERRKAVLEDFQESLGEGTMRREDWVRHLEEWNGDSHTGDLRPYCQIVIDYIRKQIRRFSDGQVHGRRRAS